LCSDDALVYKFSKLATTIFDALVEEPEVAVAKMVADCDVPASMDFIDIMVDSNVLRYAGVGNVAFHIPHQRETWLRVNNHGMVEAMKKATNRKSK
jgi:hypothetical protein